MDEQQSKSGNLLHNLILFGRLLRALGMDVNPGRMIDSVQALDHVEIGSRTDFYFTLRSLLVHKKDDLPLFDHAFDLFWVTQSGEGIPIGHFLTKEEDVPQQVVTLPTLNQQEERDESSDDGADDETQTVIEVTRTFSRREVLRDKDFGQMTAGELQEIKRFIAEIVWQLGQRLTRRKRNARRGRFLDMRRTFRRNLRYGGEMLEWPRRERKFKQRPLIILADISGSMEQYSRLLLHFIYSLTNGLEQGVEAFVFSTRLTRITRQLRGRDVDNVLIEVSHKVYDWAGGTRIGEALKSFNFEWGRRVLGRGAIVLLISDGWDRGDPQLLHEEMGRLNRSSYRLIWLNPLLGSTNYEPLTRGMQAALPFIDDFLPVHNLTSLEDLANHLGGLTVTKRPFRRPAIIPGGVAFVGR